MGQYKAGLLIGRFQPFHNGHLFLFKETFDKVDKLIIGIGTPGIKDAQNPYSFEERKKMLKRVIKKEGWTKKVIAILPITDYLEDDQLWLRKTFETVLKRGELDIFIGNDDWTAGIFEKNGYKVWRTGFYKRYLYEGEKIRKLMREGKKWEDRVPSYLINLVRQTTLS